MADHILPTVAELQASRTQHLERAIRDITASIRSREDKGYRKATYWPKPNEPIDQIKAVLQKAGYNVNVKTDMDPRSGGGKYMDITWS